MATLIRAGGGPEDVQPADGHAFTLPELQQIVGGYIEVVRAADGRLMFLNEDGKRLNLPWNGFATFLVRGLIGDDDYIVGDVVLCTRTEAGEDAEEEET